MKIADLSLPAIGDIVEFETDPHTIVEGVIVGETADGYIYEFSAGGYRELEEACTYGKYYCSTDRKWKCRQGPKQSRNVSEEVQEFYTVVETAGYVARNSREAQDPRFSSSLTVDIQTDTLRKQLSKFFPTAAVKDGQTKISESKINELLNTSAANVKWGSPDSAVVTGTFTASNDVDYSINVMDPYMGPPELDPYSFFESLPDNLADDARYIEFVIKTEKGSPTSGKTGIEGTGAAAEVFGIVSNALIEYAKKFKPSMLYFYANEPNRQKLYAAIVNRLVRQVPGWAVKTAEPGGFAVYNSALFKNNGVVAEAEYQGRDVPLNKPMRGDVKKFKVYVRDPDSGNVKKVNFGHGGTSAKRLGQKTMRIRKSDPARRRNFRARHRCHTAKDRTTARYWSCKAW